MATIPTSEQIRAWLKVSPAALSDEELETVRAGELAHQLKTCSIPLVPPEWIEDVYPADLALALYRRCARTVAARGVPLGLTGSDEYGPARLPAFDAEIERYERPHRKIVFG